MSSWSKCPRCGSGTFENLRSFSHCVECLYFDDSHISLEAGAFQAHKIQKELERAATSKKSHKAETEEQVLNEAI